MTSVTYDLFNVYGHSLANRVQCTERNCAKHSVFMHLSQFLHMHL